MNIEAIVGMMKAAGRKTEHNGYDKYELLSLRGVFSPGYNYLFDIDTGEFCRWGTSLEDDPQKAPSPELLDWEISTGNCIGCRWCYKSNGPEPGKNIDFEVFKSIFAKLPPTICQIAYGITNIDTHPQFVDILEYTKANGFIGNFTTNGLHFDKVDLPKIVSLVGAIAVSAYEHLGKEVCYNAVRQLKDLGLEQTNIHLLYHADNLPFVYEVLQDVAGGVVSPNAVVLLGLKPKGRGSDMKSLPQEDFTHLVEWCLENKLPMGFDSCTCTRFLRAIDALGVEGAQRDYFHTVAEPCESGLFSLYADVSGNVFPCSFCEDKEGIEPISLLDAEDFVRDVWNSESMSAWRDRLLANNRACPVYNID